MLRFSDLIFEAAVANQSGAMEADTISKNGRSLKSQMSKGNMLLIFFRFIVMLVIMFSMVACGGGGSKGKKIHDGTYVSTENSSDLYIFSGNKLIIDHHWRGKREGTYNTKDGVLTFTDEFYNISQFKYIVDGDKLIIYESEKNGFSNYAIILLKSNNGKQRIEDIFVFDGKKIKAVLENGSAYNSKISKVIAFTNNANEEFITGPYSNGGFTLTLPKKPKDIFFLTMDDLQKDANNLKISNMKAKVIFVGPSFGAFGSDENKYVGSIYYTNENSYNAVFVYSDRKVTLKKDSGDVLIDLSLKKGWNMVLDGGGIWWTPKTVIDDLKWRLYH